MAPLKAKDVLNFTIRTLGRDCAQMTGESKRSGLCVNSWACHHPQAQSLQGGHMVEMWPMKSCRIVSHVQDKRELYRVVLGHQDQHLVTLVTPVPSAEQGRKVNMP